MDIEQALDELDLRTGASAREVRQAWRKQVRQWHPDRNPSAEAVVRMQRINHAFAVLKAAGWDEGEQADAGAGAGAAHAGDDTAATQAEAEAGDAGRKRKGRNSDAPAESPRHVRRKQALTLEEAASGCIKVLRGKFSEACPECDGAGHHIQDRPCPDCDGRGKTSARLWFGWMATESECEACAGTGKARTPCATCEGTGTLSHPYRVSVRIPPGARAGDVLRVTSPRGSDVPIDFELAISLRRHELFHLDDAGTLCCGMPVNGFAWIGNGEVEVPTLGGLTSLQLERGKYLYHLPGQGYPLRQGGARGDLVVTVQPRFPAELDATQNALLMHLAATSEAEDDALVAWRKTLDTWTRVHAGEGARARRQRKRKAGDSGA